MKIATILMTFVFVLLTSTYALAAKNPAACQYPFYDKGAIQGVSYLDGGVGKEERSCLALMAKEYDLKLVFALSSGPYLSNETVTIQDQNGREVLHRKADGPWMFVKLLAGDYKVTVSRDGHKSEVRHVKVGNGMLVENFIWKS